MRTPLLCLFAAALGASLTALLPARAHAAGPARSPEDILASYVADFRNDPAAATPRTFGVRVDGPGGGHWTVEVTGEKDADGAFGVELREGRPDVATFVYTVDDLTLGAIDAGLINALTAQGKAFPGEPTPMAIEWVDGAQPVDVNAFSFHFWTRGFPERVPFRRELSRQVHGVGNVVFYYQPGFRSAWTSIAKGERANNGPGVPIQVPFNTLVIALEGRAKGLVNGQPTEVRAGEMVFIPPMTAHEWWNEDDEPCEALLVFCGEGA